VSTYVGQRLVVDGIIGPLTRQQMADYYISFATVGDIMFWQGKFGVTQDGIVGPITAMALQRYINTL
jgi:peptidoglycan hydrolase-like protein with peptidoglycan-binding domain